MRVISRFVLAASDVAHFPAPSLPEIAFLGRSNVGKSSVINALVGKKLARTSSTPGRTQTINFYEIRIAGQPKPELFFTDLPGYGYSKVSREVSREWARFVNPYLGERRTLALCLALIDSNIPPQESDRMLLEFLGATGREHLVVATKCDRMSANERSRSLATLREEYSGVRLIPFSAKTGAGRDELWALIREFVSKSAAV